MTPLNSLPAFKTLFSVLAFSAASLAIGIAPSYAGNLAALQIIDRDTGQPMKIWRHQGKNYVAGQPNQRYSLQVRNKLNQRLLAVIAVDGINIITGSTASEQQSGYVLSGWQQANYEGWRKSNSDVAAFYFTSLGDSYAARTGRADQAGVIGVALFREKESQLWYSAPRPVYRDHRGEAASNPESPAPLSGSNSGIRAKREYEGDHASEARRNEKLGTGHGERIDSPSTSTTFERASRSANEVLTVYYDSYQNLQARGIIPRYTYPPYPDRNHPAPFPNQFVPDPY